MTREAAMESARQMSTYPQVHCAQCVVEVGKQFHIIGKPYVKAEFHIIATFRDGKEVTCPNSP